jgi:chaperone required for assembly of F1-ATPase
MDKDRSTIDTLGLDIATQMYEALTDGADADPSAAMTREEHARYIKKYVNTITTADRREIGGILLQFHGPGVVTPCAEGVVVNLDQVSAAAMLAVYKLVEDKVSTLPSFVDEVDVAT